MKLGFSTLGCPEWSIEKICNEGSRLGYQGVGIRGIQGEFDLTKIEALSEEQCEATIRSFREAGLEIVVLGSSCRFTLPDPAERVRNLEDGKAAIDIAKRVGARMVRVYGGVIPESMGREEAIRLVSESLAALGDYAAGSGVMVAIETHDDFTESALLREVLERTKRENVRVLWDISNCYRAGEEDLAHTWDNIGAYVVHTHFKDSVVDPSHELGYRYCPMGEGDLPNREALRVLEAGGYNGYLSFEWETAWHPELADPSEVFPQYVATMRDYLAEL